MNAIFDDSLARHIEAMSLHLDANLAGSVGGSHKTMTYGSTTEFADYREYVLGDDVRHIDWNIFSRFEKYYIKQFTDERRMHTQILLDCSASMDAAPQKSRHALRIAAALGFLSVHSMDKLAIRLIKGGEIEDIDGTISGKEAFYNALLPLEKASFGGDSDFETAVLNCGSLGLNDGLTVLISDFFTAGNWKKAVDYLLFRKRRVLLVQVLSPEEADPYCKGRINFLDAETAGDAGDGRHLKLKVGKDDLSAYRSALAEFLGDIKKFCSDRGVFYVYSLCTERLEKSLLEKLYFAGIAK